ncbi:Amine oxidase flavin-containing A [Hondaea fermentalgiana]|uniref:Amine oxidase flavin-containing A n=1 Tax=Hondaea fermentalgiana TaxID=2315210 RepID=A0A2R5GGY5_9STRA|nr:Amine oxidase flavin-containing A [Hondaea fermentalgiana]|eukprot:GBG29018.1 Amine oxidase flavin-containing A [Hondaea fermentalgiana]
MAGFGVKEMMQPRAILVMLLLLGMAFLTVEMTQLDLTSNCGGVGAGSRLSSLRPPAYREAIVAQQLANQEPMSSLIPFMQRTDSVHEKTVDLASDHFPNVLAMQLEDLGHYDILIIGAGLSGTVLADLYARKHGKKVLIIERRPHIGGNCFDFREEETDILVNLYGAHLFHTGKEDVWKYVHRFSEWTPYEHRVVGRVDGKLVPIPVNIDTVNALLGEEIYSEDAMDAWLTHERRNSPVGEVDVSTAKNSREVGMGRVGERLYNKLFKEYTKKQWNVYPEELGPVVLSRIPVRNDWDDRYFPNDKHQALPADGYTRWFEEALDHPNIRVFTSTDYFESLKLHGFAKLKFEKTFFTGQIDQYFRNIKGSKLKPLQYRSIKFETIVRDEPSVSQPAFVVNFPQFRDGNHTRTAEYKHMYHQDSQSSILIREYSTDIVDDAEPYYPFPTKENEEHFEQYRELAKSEETQHNVHFVGRLANYKYFNMDDAIQNALDLYVKIEGRKRLDAALAEAIIPSENEMTVHYVLTVRRNSPGLKFLSDICRLPTWSLTASMPMKNVIFVYNMDRSRDGIIDAQVNEALASAGCQHDTRLGKGLFIRNVASTNDVELNWLEHFSAHSFAFGDANVFLDADVSSDAIAQIPRALTLQAEHLFAKKRTRASQPLVFKNDIRIATMPTSAERWTLASKFSLLPSQQENLLHALPLREDGLTFGSKPMSARKIASKLFPNSQRTQACPFMAPEAFVATDAAIRRMLSIHRTTMYDDFIPAMRADRNSMHRAVLRENWYCLFFRF